MLNVRFSSVFSVTFVGAQRETPRPKHAWPGCEPDRESVNDHDRLRAANSLNQRWAKEGRKAVIIYQLSDRDLMPGALPRTQPYFYLDGDDYHSFQTLHDKEFPIHQQDELAADWNRGEWSKRFLRVCQALADRLITHHDKTMQIEASRWAPPVILDDPSITATPEPVPLPLPNLAPLAADTIQIAGTTVPNPASHGVQATDSGPLVKSDATPTAA